MDSNHRRRKPADLQSAPFGHSGNYPFKIEIFRHSSERNPDFDCKGRHNFETYKLFRDFFSRQL